MKEKQLNFKRVIIVAGSFIAFAIGSGFSTGQEILQFFSAFGTFVFIQTILFFVGNLYVNYNFLEAGRIGKFEKASQVFNYFCGKYVGAFFDWFAVVFTYMSFFVMVSGAGATLNQHFGIPTTVGAIIIAAMAGVTVMFGLNKLVDIIGRLGPVIIGLCIIGGIIGIVTGPTSLAEVNELLPTLNVPAAGSSWYTALIAYLGFGMMWFAPFFAEIGKNEENPRDAQVGAVVGVGVLSITVLLIAIALLRNIEMVAESQIPLMTILQNLNPVVSSIFSIVIFLGIYTTACPLLWTPCNRLAKEGSKTYKILSLVLAGVGCIIGLLVPYAKVVNIIYGINGKIGFVLVAFIIYKNITTIVNRKKGITE